MIVPYLDETEYRCKHCNVLPPDYADHPEIFAPFFDLWTIVREQYGRPITINSGYRCPIHNKEVGGEECSAHCTGLALDIRGKFCSDKTELIQIVEEFAHDLRMKIYGCFIHIDAAWLARPRLRENWIKGYRFYV